MVKERRTLNISPEVLKELRKIQGQILAETGKKISIQEIADDLIKKEIRSTPQGVIKFGVRFD